MECKLRVTILKGHERPLTTVKFNRDGDLLFSAAKDKKPCVWFTSNGERLGTFNGHEGGVWHLDVNDRSTLLLTGSGDKTARLWEVETGREKFKFEHASAVRCVGFAHGDQMILTAQDNSFSQTPTIFIYNLARELSEQDSRPVRELKEEDLTTKISSALWGPLNQTIVSGGDDGTIRVWDVERGVQISKITQHKKKINSIQFSKDKTMFITASSDMTAKLFDTKTLQLLKTFTSDRPLNTADVSSIMNHVIVGGGQDAMDVTTTDARSGHFEVDFFHSVYSEKLASVKGHFGPVHTVAFSPDGKSYASGSEDGYVRLHHMDNNYAKLPMY